MVHWTVKKLPFAGLTVALVNLCDPLSLPHFQLRLASVFVLPRDLCWWSLRFWDKIGFAPLCFCNTECSDWTPYCNTRGLSVSPMFQMCTYRTISVSKECVFDNSFSKMLWHPPCNFLISHLVSYKSYKCCLSVTGSRHIFLNSKAYFLGSFQATCMTEFVYLFPSPISLFYRTPAQ